MRYVVLPHRRTLAEVAACWPLASIEHAALWIYEAASDRVHAEQLAAHQFRGRRVVVLEYAEAEAMVVQLRAKRMARAARARRSRRAA